MFDCARTLTTCWWSIGYVRLRQTRSDKPACRHQCANAVYASHVTSFPANVSLHEASVLGVRRESDRTLAIELGDVYVEGQLRSARLMLHEVRSVKRDGEVVDAFTMHFADGEILSFNSTERGVALIIEWTDFQSGESVIAGNEIECASVELQF